MLRWLSKALLVCTGLLSFGCLDETGRRSSVTDHRTQIAHLYRDYRAESFPEVPDITVREALSQSERRPVIFVDCRENEEREVSAIPGSISKAQFEADRESYRRHLVVPYCTIGYRSGLYTRELDRDGFDTSNLIGGVLSWAHEGETFHTPAGESTRAVHVYGPTWNLLPDPYQPFWDGAPRR